MAMPGIQIGHQAMVMKLRPSEIMAPQEGVPGATPTLRK